MKGVFNADSFLMRLLSRFADLVIINVLWITCSLPVFTFGAATTAVYDVMLRLADGDDGSAVKNFFSAFVKNFRRSTLIWLILLAVGAVAAADLYASLFTELLGSVAPACAVFAGLLAAVWLMSCCWAFVLEARFENTLKATVKNSLLIAVLELPRTLLFVLVTAGTLALPFFAPQTLFFWLFIGYALAAYLLAKLYLPVLKKYGKTE